MITDGPYLIQLTLASIALLLVLILWLKLHAFLSLLISSMVLGLGAGMPPLAEWMLEKVGRDRAAWAMMFSAFLVGLPIFFEVGFIILVPLVWSLARESKRSLLYDGLPMAMALTVTHSLVPPHPAPAAASAVFGADLGRTILFGIVVSLPMAIAGGIFYGKWISKRIHLPVPAIAANSFGWRSMAWNGSTFTGRSPITL